MLRKQLNFVLLTFSFNIKIDHVTRTETAEVRKDNVLMLNLCEIN